MSRFSDTIGAINSAEQGNRKQEQYEVYKAEQDKRAEMEKQAVATQPAQSAQAEQTEQIEALKY